MSFFKTNKKESISGIGMWSTNKLFVLTEGEQCCSFQTSDPNEDLYLAPCCVETFLHDKKQFNTSGSIVRDSYPWKKTKKPS